MIVEAKGGKRLRNPASRWSKAGRKVIDDTGQTVLALQGTRRYFDETLQLMRTSSDASVAAAGELINSKLAEGKVEYYVSVARWAGKRGQEVRKGVVYGVSRIVRVFKVAL